MEEPGFLKNSRVVIWGLGLMGGSLAMALKGRCASLTGIDIDPKAVAAGIHRSIVDRAFTDPQRGLEGADLILLAAPVRTIIRLLNMLPALFSGECVVMDLGSTKRRILETMDLLPERFDPIGGHPMCGKEKSTLEFADPQIYLNAPFALVPLERTTARARMLAQELAASVGSRHLWLSPFEHDRWVAATSHAPFLLSSALALATPEESAPLVGPGFRGAARLAGSSPRMMADIVATNTAPIQAAIGRIRSALDQFDDLIEQGRFEELADLFAAGGERYRFLTNTGENQ